MTHSGTPPIKELGGWEDEVALPTRCDERTGRIYKTCPSSCDNLILESNLFKFYYNVPY
jgi:hypothetical protein